MNRFLFLSTLLVTITTAVTAQVSVRGLLCENQTNPPGIGTAKPFLSWQLTSNRRNVSQTAYEIRVSNRLSNLKEGTIWKSGKVSSDQSVLVPYAGPALQSATSYYWQVRVWDEAGKASEWSAPARWQTGLFSPADWKAEWIEFSLSEPAERPTPLFRKQLSVGKKIERATAFITAHGLYEAFINGRRVGDFYLTPGWTSYNKRLQYQAYDVTDLLQQGENVLGAMLGSGWYRGNLAWGGNKDSYGKDIALLWQIHVTYADGSREIFGTDETWKTSLGAIRSSEIYHGERYDARAEPKGWLLPRFDDKGWAAVRVKPYPKEHLIATENEPIKKHEVFQPVKLITTPKGEKVIDFGQNLVGWVQVKVKGKPGDSISIHHAEVLDKQGNFYTENLRAAKQLNTYILRGGEEEIFEPHFTFQGFRYIKIEGLTDNLNADHFKAIALYSAMKPTGTFTSSHPLLNQLQHNIQWGQKGNFLDVPTDCPQRDERLGWTGDAQVFSRTAAFNMNVHNFFAKWLKDVAADQLPNGSVPFVVPNVLGANSAGSAGWADAAVIIPWNIYLAYGDKRILETQYPSMKAWVEFMRQNSENNLWNKGFHFGDWLFYRPNDDNDGRSAITDKYLIAQAFFAHSTQLLINTARVLNKKEDEEMYSRLLQQLKEAFVKEYMTPTGRLVSGSQTAYVLALNFDLLPENLRRQAAERLVNNIASYGNHLTTGFLGTPYLCHVLTRFGYDDVAYKLLLQESYPSWLYPVKMGATTIWERWDGQKPDSSFQTPGMNSFNHYAYGAIGDWMYRVMAGLDTDEAAPGYKRSKIKPHIGQDLTAASATLETYYGPLWSQWKKEGAALLLDVTIPANTRSLVYLPAANAAQVRESGTALSQVKGLTIIGTEGNYLVVEAGSGMYQFVIDAK